MKCDFCFCVPHSITEAAFVFVSIKSQTLGPGPLSIEGKVSMWAASTDSGSLGFHPSGKPPSRPKLNFMKTK